jgi:hypothetical protein
MSIDFSDYSIISFVTQLNAIFENETFKYSYYEFEKQILKDKNSLFCLLERINNIYKKKTNIICKNELNCIYHELNANLKKYEVTEINNIQCGKILKYKNRKDIPIQLYEGYYYSFTVIYKKKYTV